MEHLTLAAVRLGNGLHSDGLGLSRDEFVEWMLACALLVIGTSLLLRARTWITALSGVASHPFTPLASGLYATLMGLVIVLCHNLWVADMRVLVTLLGWLSLCSGVLLLLIPEADSFVLRRIPITPQLVALRGFIRVLLGGAIFSYLVTQG
jgi:pheromone shutdown protein TraB